jgi:hypothetical protein
MSKVTATFDGFVGHGGSSVPLNSGDEYDSEHPLVKAHPGLFTEPEAAKVEEAPKAPAKTTATKASARTGAKDG